MRMVCWQTILMKYHTLFFFRNLGKMSKSLSSAAVMIGALRVNGQTFSCVFEQFSFTSKFAKIEFFKDKMVLRVVFIKLTFRWLKTSLSDL